MEAVINQTITSKYKEVVEAVRNSMKFGADLEKAVETAIGENWYLFDSNDDMDILRGWFYGTFSKVA